MNNKYTACLRITTFSGVTSSNVCKISSDVNPFMIYSCNGTENSLHNVNFLMYRSHVTFGLLNSHQMQQLSHLHVVSKNLYSQDGGRKPVPFGALDHKMV